MKKLLLFSVLLFSLCGFSQYKIKNPIVRQLAGGDTLDIKLEKDSSNVKFVTDKDGYTFDKPVNVAGVSLALSLGETSVTAYRGDRGKVAYDFATGNYISDSVKSDIIYCDAIATKYSALNILNPNGYTGIQISSTTSIGTEFSRMYFTNSNITIKDQDEEFINYFTTYQRNYYYPNGKGECITILDDTLQIKIGGIVKAQLTTDSLKLFHPIYSDTTIQSQGIYASLEVDSVTTAQSMTNGVWNKITAFNKVGLTENCTAVADSVIITKTGKYDVQFNFCSQSATGGVNVETCVFVNGVKNSAHTVRDLLNTESDSNVACSRFISLTAGDILDVRVKHDNGTPINLTTIYGSFSVKYIGN